MTPYSRLLLKYRQMIGLIQFCLFCSLGIVLRLVPVQITGSVIKRNFWSVIFKNYFRFVGKRKSVLLASLDCTSWIWRVSIHQPLKFYEHLIWWLNLGTETHCHIFLSGRKLLRSDSANFCPWFELNLTTPVNTSWNC